MSSLRPAGGRWPEVTAQLPPEPVPTARDASPSLPPPPRMNKAPTAGFEAHVGSKTTHHLVYPESFRELAENVSMVLVPFKTTDLEWVISATTTGTISQ